VLASLGGIIMLFSAICIFLNSIFGRIKFLQAIISELFLIKHHHKLNKDKNLISNEYSLDLDNFGMISKKEFWKKYLLNINK